MSDYHDFTTIDTPKEERRRLNVGDIWINAAECLVCGDQPRSTNRHDFRPCKCGNVSVDGGSWYVKRSFRTGDWKSIIIHFSDVKLDDEDE
jgi:hypothetical protein